MLQSLLFLNALCFGVGMPLVCQENTQQVQEKVEFKQDNKKFVSYNDEEYKITLTADELNNYTWNNLCNYIITEELTDYVSNMEYNSTTLSSVDSGYDTSVDGTFAYFYNSYDVSYLGLNPRYDEQSSFDNFRLNKFSIVDRNSFTYYTFEYDLLIEFNDSIYSDIKQAIELDIQANQNTQPHLQPVLTELVSLLTAGITALASGIGTGVSTLVSDIFINNGALSTFGAVICIFGGIALAIGLCRWVMNFLTSLGAKK